MSRVFFFLFIFLLFGCDAWVNMGGASGSLEDNYVEEPLDSPFDQYVDVLDISNAAMNFLQEGQSAQLYEKLFSDSLQSRLTSTEFSRNIDGFFHKKGRISEFKEMQWAFFPTEEDRERRVKSIKIGKHGGIYIAYVFIFHEDDGYEKISEFQVSPLDGKVLTKVMSG